MALAPTNPLIKSFNSLPRKEKAPSGRVPNTWHFDVRYVQLEPAPSHVLALLNPLSQFIHMERLPLGLAPSESGIAFFPESAREAAPEVARALLHAFVDRFGQEKVMGDSDKAPAAFRPWKLTTSDRALAVEVGDELKRVGVSPDELHKVGVAGPSVIRIMDEAFERLFGTLKQSIGLTGLQGAVIRTPQYIGFSSLKYKPHERFRHHLQQEAEAEETDDMRLMNLALEYGQKLVNARPPMESNVETKVMLQQQAQEVQVTLRRVREKPERVVKAEADSGDCEAAFDYGVRLLVGLGCKADRTQARNYLIKALSSPLASNALKATAHGLLITWYIDGWEHDFRTRNLFLSCHHANLAARLCRLVSPKKVHSSPAVLYFMARVFRPRAEEHVEVYMWYRDAIGAMEFRERQYASGRERMEGRRLRMPNRYRCAAVGCGIEADTGRMLMQCSGKCDPDKKPHYCSRECQKSDWANHKPFCKPGMPCSVLDPSPSASTSSPSPNPSNPTANPSNPAASSPNPHPTVAGSGSAGPASKEGAIQVPITHADGSTHVVSSSTLGPGMLREIRDYAQGAGVDLSGTGLRSLCVEMERVVI